MNLLLCLFAILSSSGPLVSSSLPAPVNVSVHSVNFHHVLRWDPAPGTPSGTQYRIFQRKRGESKKKMKPGTATHLKLKLHSLSEYFLSVQAFNKNNTSLESESIKFSPYKDTIIDPPKLWLAGCGNCIYGNISLPEPDSSSDIDDLQTFYAADFEILWSKPNEPLSVSEAKQKNFFNLTNLERGKEYCVQVKTLTSLRKLPLSNRVCTFTSIVEPSRVPALLGVATILILIVIGSLIILMFCLYYTGWLCKLKSSVPRALILEKLQDKIITLEKMIPDLISISSETDKQREWNNPTRPHAGESEEDDEEDNEDERGEKSYMYRQAKGSSSEICQDSCDVSGISKLASSTDFDRECETHDETRTEEPEVALIPKWSPSGVKGHVESDEENIKDKEETCDTLMNVNLLSITLAAMTGSATEEEQQQDFPDSHTDILKASEARPLLPTHSKQTLCHVDSPIETVDQTIVEFLQPPQDIETDATGYMGRYKNSCLTDGVTQEEEEDDEEEFSEYMGRR